MTTTQIHQPTERQAAVLTAIAAHWRDHRTGPTIRDLCRALGISSPNGVVCHLDAPKAKGLIVWGENATARAIWTTEVWEYLGAMEVNRG